MILIPFNDDLRESSIVSCGVATRFSTDQVAEKLY